MLYPDIKEAYSLSHSLRMIYNSNSKKDVARLSLARWYNKVDIAGFKSFNVIAATIYEHYEEVLNYFNNRSTNAFAESFNAKIKQFRAALRGISDVKFFFFRLTKLYAYPHPFSGDPESCTRNLYSTKKGVVKNHSYYFFVARERLELSTS